MCTNQSRRRLTTILITMSVLSLTPCFADETAETRQAKQALGKWIMTYYQNPAPAEFVEKVKQMSALGFLNDPRPNARPDANVMFLGKVMEANAQQIPQWMDALAGLPEADFKVVKRAVWYSGTETGKAWLIDHGEAKLANGPRPVLLAKQRAIQMQPYHLDQLWEWFFATGSDVPVTRIASLFSLAHEPPNAKTLQLISPPPRSDDKRQNQIQLYNFLLLRPALWSTTSLAVQHDRVLTILKQLQQKENNPRMNAWVGQVIRIAAAKRDTPPAGKNATDDVPLP